MPRISLVFDEVAQAIGAEDERVSGDVGDRLRTHVDLDRLGHSERTGDAVRIRVAGGLLQREQPAIDHLLDDRVIARDSRNLSFVDEVHAAVADVRDLRSACMGQHGDHGRTRPAEGDLAGTHRVDAAAGLLEGGAQDRRGRRALRRGIERLEDGRQGQLRRFAPRGVSAHSVAHDAQVAEAGLAAPARVLVDLLFRIASRIRTLRVLDCRKPELGLLRVHVGVSTLELHAELDGPETQERPRGNGRPGARRQA